MAEQLKIVIDADVSKAVAGIQTLSKVITADFSKAAQIASTTADSLTKSIDLLKNQFQSIGKIKIDSSDLTAIQAKLDSIKIKPLTLDFELKGQGEVDAAIQSIKAKFESLKFNPDLSVFNEIVAEINKLKSNEILLHVDNSEALAAVNKIQSSLNSIKGDILITGNIDQAIAGIKEKIASLRTIDLKADPSQAILAIDKIISEITKIKDTDVLLRADNSGALKSINQLESQLKDIRANVVINTTGFEAAKKSVLDIDKAFGEATGRIDTLIDKMVSGALGGVAEIKAGFENVIPKGAAFKIDIDATAALAKIQLLEKELADLQKLSISPNISSTQFALFQKNIDQVKLKLNELRGKDVGTFVFKANAAPAIKEITALQAKVISLDRTLKATSGLSTFQSALGKSTSTISALQSKASNLNSFYNNLAVSTKAAAGGFEDLGKKATTAGAATTSSFSKAFQGLKTFANIIPGLGISTLFGVIISAVTALGEALIKTSSKAKTLREATSEAIGSSTGDIFKINAAVATIKDLSSSINAQTNAREFLNKQTGISVDLLTREKIGSEETTAAIKKATDAIFQRALAEAFAAKSAAKQVELFEKQQKLNAALAALPTSAVDFLKIGANIGNTATAAGVLANQIEKIKQEIKDIETFGQDAFKKAFDVPPPVKTGKAFKDVTDDILAKARQFVKEFGDVFVLPNLEDSFFTKKGDLVKAAGNLLANVKKEIEQKASILQIKIPVDTHLVSVKKTEEILDEVTGQFKTVTKNVIIRVPIVTEFDLLPESFTPLSKEELDKITDTFIKNLQPVEVPLPLQFTISQNQTKEFDRLQEEFTKLGERAKTAFANISFGAKDGTNQVAAFTAGLKKANEELTRQKLLADRKLNFTAFVEVAVRKTGKKDEAGNEILKDLSDSAKEAALLINDTLTPAFENLFDAIIAGKNPLKAFFESIVQSISQVIKKLIAAAVQAAILSAITGGAAGKFGDIFTKLLGVGGTTANNGFGLGGAIGSRSFQNTLQVVVSGSLSGQTILLAGQRAAISNQRGG